MTRAKGKNYIFLFAAVLVGETVISQSFWGNFAGDILGKLCGLVVAAIAIIFCKRCYAKHSAGGTFKTLSLLAVFLASFFSFVVCILSFSSYASAVMLKSAPFFIPLISFAALSVYAMRKGVNLKLGVVLFFVSALFILLIFLFSLPFMEFKYLTVYKAPSFIGFLYTFGTTLANAFLSALPLVFLDTLQNGKRVIWGFVLGGILILTCLINTFGIFGAEFAADLSFPYSSAVFTASVGDIFSRMDPFLYFICFFTCLLKCSVCLSAATLAVKKINFKILFRKNKLYY